MLDGILGNIYSYIGVQRGRVGEAVGQKIAQKAVHHFMSSGFDNLSLESRESLYPALSIAAKSIHADTMGSLAVSTRIRKDVKTDVADRLAPLGDMDLFASKVDTVQGGLERFQTDFGSFQNAYQDFNGSYQKFSDDANRVEDKM